MAKLTASIDAQESVPGVMTHCSWNAGWRSLLLRTYNEKATFEEFTTPANADQLIVLITEGRCTIESQQEGGWRRAMYDVGSLGMTAPGQEAKLRLWRDTPMSTMHLHLAFSTMQQAAQALWGRELHAHELPNSLKSNDPALVTLILLLAEASKSGVPDVYAETAADFVAMHLLLRHHGFSPLEPPVRDDPRLQRVNAYLREHLGMHVSLENLSKEAGTSRFHLLRLFKQAYGETPFRRLTKMRIEKARHLLSRTSLPVTQIAFECGYDNPSHFATAFRRETGFSPKQFRAARQ